MTDPSPPNIKRARHYAVNTEGGLLVLVKFIWTQDRDKWCRQKPKNRFPVKNIRKMGVDGLMYPIEGNEKL